MCKYCICRQGVAATQAPVVDMLRIYVDRLNAAGARRPAL